MPSMPRQPSFWFAIIGCMIGMTFGIVTLETPSNYQGGIPAGWNPCPGICPILLIFFALIMFLLLFLIRKSKKANLK